MATRASSCEQNSSALQLQSYSAKTRVPAAPQLLLIHGWGSSSSIWSAVLDQLQSQMTVHLVDLPGCGVNRDCHFNAIEEFVSALVELLEQQIDGQLYVCGWSLGGVCASLLAQRMPERLSGLITVATSPQFVARSADADVESCNAAMSIQEFEHFRLAFATSPKKTLNRFLALQTRGNTQASANLRSVRELVANDVEPNSAALETGLDWLANTSLHSCWRELAIPVLHQYGVSDQLVPDVLASEMTRLYPQQCVLRFANSAHLPFVSEPAAWTRSVIDFVCSQQARNVISKKAIAQSFSSAAGRYDQLANIQQQVGNKLLQLLPETVDGAVLDYGSGTGFFTDALSERLAQKQVFALDIAGGMLDYSSANRRHAVNVQADMEQMPFAENSFALIFSSLSLQWCSILPSAVKSIWESLEQGGIAVVSTLVDGSLRELSDAWQAVDGSAHAVQGPARGAVHVNQFETEHFLQHCFSAAGFETVHWQVEHEIDQFDSVAGALRSIKGIGAHNQQKARAPGLLSVRRYRYFVSELERSMLASGQYQLGYRVLYAVLRKPLIAGSSHRVAEAGV